MYNEKCKAQVLKSETLPECSNEQKVPKGITEPVIGKIPVVLAEPVIQVDVESVIKLEEPAIEIKRIKKNLFITQCKVVNIGCENAAKLFLSGYVRKNIEYATSDCYGHKGESISGDIKHTTVQVPFRCVTKVSFDSPAIFNYQQPPREASLFFEQKKGKDCCEQSILGSNPCEQNFEHFECFNEEIFCELEESKIYEVDIHKKGKNDHCDKCEPCSYDKDSLGQKDFYDDKDDFDKYSFNEITEKMVIFIRLKLLQNQQVSIKDHSYCANDMKKKK